MSDADHATDDRAAQWWRAVEEEVARRQEPRPDADADDPTGESPPDPWAGAAPHVAPLTDEQHELLVRVADQPEVPRLHRLDPADLADDDLDGARDVRDAGGSADPAPRSALAAILDRAVDDVTRAAGDGGDSTP